MNLPKSNKFGLTAAEIAEAVSEKQAPTPETFDPPLDPGIAPYVDALRAAGVETYESCQGGEGHAFPVPTVRFHGNNAAGLRALSAALDADLPVSGLRRVWDVIAREATGPTWEMVFSRMSFEHRLERLILGPMEKTPENEAEFVPKDTAAALRDGVPNSSSSEWVDLDWIASGIEGAVYDRQKKAGADFGTSETRGAMAHAIARALEAGLKERGVVIKPASIEPVPVGQVFDRNGVGLYLADVVELAKHALGPTGFGPHAPAGQRVLAAVREWESRSSAEQPAPESEPGPPAPAAPSPPKASSWGTLADLKAAGYNGAPPSPALKRDTVVPRLAFGAAGILSEIPAEAEVVESWEAEVGADGTAPSRTVRGLAVSPRERVVVLRLKSGAERVFISKKDGVAHVFESPAPTSGPTIGRDPSVAVVLAEPIGDRRAFLIGMFHLGTHFIEPGHRGMRKMEGHRFDVVLMERGADADLTREALRRLRKGGFACEVFFDREKGVGVAPRSATVALAQADRALRELTPSAAPTPEHEAAFAEQNTRSAVVARESLIVPHLSPGEVHEPYTSIRVERAYQDKKWGGPVHDDDHSTGEFVQLIRTYCAKADEEMRMIPAVGEKGKRTGIRHRLVQIAALAVAAIESIDRTLGTKVVHAPDLAGERARLLDEIDRAFTDLDGGEEDFIPKPQKIPGRLRDFTKKVREAVGSEHPGVGWTLLDRFKESRSLLRDTADAARTLLGDEIGPLDPQHLPNNIASFSRHIRSALGSHTPTQKGVGWALLDRFNELREAEPTMGSFDAVPARMPEQLRLQIRQAWDLAKKKHPNPKPFFAFWGEVSDLGLNIRSWASARNDAALPKDISTRPAGADPSERSVRIARPADMTGASNPATVGGMGTTEGFIHPAEPPPPPVVVVLLAEPLLGAREYIRGFFEPSARFVEPGSALIPPPIDVLVVERGARDVDLARLKARLAPGGVVLPVDFARGTMTITPHETKPKKDAPPFKASVPAKYTTWTAKADMVVHWHPVRAGETVTVAERGDEVFVRVAGGEWLAPGKLPERVAAVLQKDLDLLGTAWVRLIKPDVPNGEWIARRVDPERVQRDTAGAWSEILPAGAAASIAPIYYVVRNNLTSNIAEAVTVSTE